MPRLELQTNGKLWVRSAKDATDTGFLVTVKSVDGNAIECWVKHYGPMGGDPHTFTFRQNKDGSFEDASGYPLTVEKFNRARYQEYLDTAKKASA